MLPHWTESDFILDGACLHYYRTTSGGSGKPPLVLAHGFSDDGLGWLPTARDLESEFDILMPDARGHGRSQRVERGELTDMPADLAGLMRGLGLAPAIVGGHSMGAVVTAQLGARFPEQVRALILEDPAWFLPREEDTERPALDEESPLGAWITNLQTLSLEEIVAQSRVEHPTWPEVALRSWCEAKTRLDLNFLSATDRVWEDWPAVVEKMRCPVLLVTADPDKGGIVTAEVAEKVTQMNPLFRVAHISGAGHHIRFEQYEPYMVAVRAFLQEIG